MKAVIHKITAIEISQVCQNRCQDIQNEWEFVLAKDTIVKLATRILYNSFPLDERKFLNVNIPPIKPNECKGM
ncbi:5'/3'-nucleotidase SurE, partial [Aliarcobacter butzleri]|uniref:5'/3'-nucleotidase SurE n=1 Tax=Aliarcobacter butzleri TaxID=28197 RepID=UPI003AF82959